MSQREEIETMIESIKSDVETMDGSMGQVIERTDSAATDESSRGHDGVAGYYLEARRILDEARASLAGIKTRLDEARATVSQTAGLTPGVGSIRSDQRPDGFSYRRPHRDAVLAIRREGWPRAAGGRVSARGHLYDGSGRRIDGVPVMKAHRKGHASPCEDLREPWRSDPEYTTTWHAERDAAKIMRDNNLREAVLYMNIPPCGNESKDPQRCDANLEKVLPSGSVLWVWILRESGYQERRRYVGTGEAIR